MEDLAAGAQVRALNLDITFLRLPLAQMGEPLRHQATSHGCLLLLFLKLRPFFPPSPFFPPLLKGPFLSVLIFVE